MDRVAFWSSPNTGTPDYFNKCFVKNFETVGVPNNFLAHDAFEGAGYAGILCGNQERNFADQSGRTACGGSRLLFAIPQRRRVQVATVEWPCGHVFWILR
ncbi:MAG: hypothetical protein IPN95_19145 [Bacteroidetes bacterium]|nr:hypothetical protein [Bacteroidota bacterium]